MVIALQVAEMATGVVGNSMRQELTSLPDTNAAAAAAASCYS